MKRIYISGAITGKTNYEEYMDMSIMLLNMCDCIFMLNGWQQSRGANREYGYALAKDMTIIS